MKTTLPLIAILTAFTHVAHAQNCVQFNCNEGYCAFEPGRFKAKFPVSFEVESIAIGHNTRIAAPGREHPANLDCSAATRLPSVTSLDETELLGSLKIAGKLQATGRLNFEPREGGNLVFAPDEKTFRNTGKFFRTYFRGINLDEAQPPIKVKLPAHLAKAECWEAKASVELSDFTVAIVDSCEGGTSARRARITAISAFSGCEPAYKK